MDLENNVKLPNPYYGMVTPGFAKGTDGSSWGWTVFPVHAAVWTNSTEPASCALLHEGGQNPCANLALNFIFALYMHIKRVKKPGWKQRKEGCSPKNGRSCCLLSGQAGEGFATCRGNKAKLHLSLPAMGVMETAILGLNWTTLTACGYFLYNQEKPFSSRGSTSGSCSGVWAWRFASTLLLWNTNSPGSLCCRISNQKSLAIISVQGAAGQGRLCSNSFLNNGAHHVALGAPRNWEFAVFNWLGLWGSFAFYFFLVYMAFTVN